MFELSSWGNFYVIVGGSAGALIGLQFVVMTLIADRPKLGSAEASKAFSTPTIVHFAVVLFLSAIVSAPWHGTGQLAWVWAAVGIAGIANTARVHLLIRRQQAYSPVLEDWAFHVVLPVGAYGALAAAACAGAPHARAGLFTAAGATLLLLFLGIHNTWDAITFLVFDRDTGEGP